MKTRFLRDREGKIDKNYVIAKDGSYIRNKITGKKLNKIYINEGYRRISITINGIYFDRISISHLQYLAWKRKIPKGYDIHHMKWSKCKEINAELKLNDDIDNLQCLTHSGHMKLHNSGENNSMYGKFHSEEWKKNHSLAMSGRFLGENNPMYGKHHSKKTKRKWSMDRSGENNPKAKLAKEDIEEIRYLGYIKHWFHQKIADKFGTSGSCIDHVLIGNSWNPDHLPKEELIRQTKEKS